MTGTRATKDAVDRILSDWRRERPDLDTSPVRVIGRLGRAAALISSAVDRNLGEHGLNAASFDLLATLRRAGPPYRMSPRDLVAASLKTSGTMTSRIDRLEAAGYVARQADPTDRRGVLVSLTPAGNAALEAALPSHLETQARLIDGLGEQERAELADLLSRLLGSLEAGPGAGDD